MNPALMSEFDRHLLTEGRHFRSYDKLGAHVCSVDSGLGTQFAVWAPEAERVSVVGSFNEWKPTASPMEQVPGSGIWTRFEPGVGQGALYKYHVVSKHAGYAADKADPYAAAAENAHYRYGRSGPR